MFRLYRTMLTCKEIPTLLKRKWSPICT